MVIPASKGAAVTPFPKGGISYKEVIKRSCNCSKSLNELPVMTSKAKEAADILNTFGHRPGFYSFNLGWISMDALLRNNMSQVGHSTLKEFTHGWL